jgi:Protein of unknown function (DUF3379)
MTCDEATVFIGGDPLTVSPELNEHLRCCRGCSHLRVQMLGFDTQLRRALELSLYPAVTVSPGPDALAAGVSSRTPPRKAPWRSARARKWGLGIGLAASLVLGVALWLSQPRDTLAAQVIDHIAQEPDSWSRTEQVSPAALATILRESGVNLRPGMAPVVYASRCDFLGHKVPHLVILTEAGPVTIMILTHERVTVTERFQADHYWGLLVPAGAGSVAVVSHTEMSLEEPARNVVRALEAALDFREREPVHVSVLGSYSHDIL